MRYVLSRVLRTGVLMALVSVVAFGVLHLLPGDPLNAMLQNNPDLSHEDYLRLRQVYGLDEPIVIGYFKWAGQAVQGDFGYSRQYKIPVENLIGPRLQNTLILTASALILALIAVLATGTLARIPAMGFIGRAAGALAALGGALPTFWLALLLIVLFSVNLHWLPPGGIQSSDVGSGFWNLATDRAKYLLMPSIVLAAVELTTWMRYARSALPGLALPTGAASATAQPLRDARLLALSVLGSGLGRLFGSLVIVETLFSYPGLGKILFDSVMGGAVMDRDFVVAIGVLLSLTWVGLVGSHLVSVRAERPRHDQMASPGEIYGLATARPESGRGVGNALAGVSGTVPGSGGAPQALLQRFACGRRSTLGLALPIVLFLFSFGGPFLNLYQPDQVNLRERFAVPSFVMRPATSEKPAVYNVAAIQYAAADAADRPLKFGHPLGTDDLGRDTMTRAMFGGRVSLGIALLAGVLAVLAAMGMASLASRLRFPASVAGATADLMHAVPDLGVLLLVSRIFPPGFWTMGLLLFVLHGARTMPLVYLARATPTRALDPVARAALCRVAIVVATWAIMTELALSYLGFGIQQPMPSWGNMLSNSQQYFFSAPWLVFFPGLLATLTVASIYLVGEGLVRALAWPPIASLSTAGPGGEAPARGQTEPQTMAERVTVHAQVIAENPGNPLGLGGM